MRQLLRLAWPAVLSYILSNAYRINDQFWIQGLGEKAQAAIGATFFVQVLTFAAVYLAVGGTLALVARATGAQDPERRNAITRHAIGFAVALGTLLALAVLWRAPAIVRLLGLRGAAAELGEEYLTTLYLFMPVLALLPVVDAIFLGRGNSRVPMSLQAISVAANYLLNPILVYGPDAAGAVAAPGAATAGRIAASLGIEGTGIGGAALATGLARSFAVLLGLSLLRFAAGVRLRGGSRLSLSATAEILGRLVRIGAPASVSIAVYALVYWALLGLVLGPLGPEATAGLGIGFQVFEGVAFPCYLGVSLATSSLVGRELGRRSREGVLQVVASGRSLARRLGLAFAVIFWFGGPLLVPLFTQDAGVAREALLYVQVLAFSQYHVAVEAVNEKVLLGSGQTGPILWISPLGNVLRVPIAFVLALGAGFGAGGVWWAINATTWLKAYLFWRRVEAGTWLERALAGR